MTHTVFLSLGSNLGDRSANLETAITCLPPAVLVIKRSSIYETPPWGYAEQPPFLNLELMAETKYSPGRLLKILKSKHHHLPVSSYFVKYEKTTSFECCCDSNIFLRSRERNLYTKLFPIESEFGQFSSKFVQKQTKRSPDSRARCRNENFT